MWRHNTQTCLSCKPPPPTFSLPRNHTLHESQKLASLMQTSKHQTTQKLWWSWTCIKYLQQSNFYFIFILNFQLILELVMLWFSWIYCHFFYIHYCINRLDKRHQIYLEVAVIDRCPDWYTPVRGDHQEVDTADVLCPHRLRVYQLSQTLEHVLCDVRNHRRLQNQQPLGVLHSKIKLLYMYHKQKG